MGEYKNYSKIKQIKKENVNKIKKYLKAKENHTKLINFFNNKKFSQSKKFKLLAFISNREN